MEPNNNQPLSQNPLGQQPVVPEPVVPQSTTPFPTAAPPVQQPVMQQAEPTPTITPLSTPDKPKSKAGKGVMLAVILILLILGMSAYILFTKNQIKNAEKAATENKTETLILPTTIPTIAPENDLEVSSPEADLKDLETDVTGL